RREVRDVEPGIGEADAVGAHRPGKYLPVEGRMERRERTVPDVAHEALAGHRRIDGGELRLGADAVHQDVLAVARHPRAHPDLEAVAHGHARAPYGDGGDGEQLVAPRIEPGGLEIDDHPAPGDGARPSPG